MGHLKLFLSRVRSYLHRVSEKEEPYRRALCTLESPRHWDGSLIAGVKVLRLVYTFSFSPFFHRGFSVVIHTAFQALSSFDVCVLGTCSEPSTRETTRHTVGEVVDRGLMFHSRILGRKGGKRTPGWFSGTQIGHKSSFLGKREAFTPTCENGVLAKSSLLKLNERSIKTLLSS